MFGPTWLNHGPVTTGSRSSAAGAINRWIKVANTSSDHPMARSNILANVIATAAADDQIDPEHINRARAAESIKQRQPSTPATGCCLRRQGPPHRGVGDVVAGSADARIFSSTHATRTDNAHGNAAPNYFYVQLHTLRRSTTFKRMKHRNRRWGGVRLHSGRVGK